nr:sugar kinase [Chloroflexota bacterium]
MTKKRFVGLGEILVRLSTEGYLRFAQADRFIVNYTGAEANIAITLSYMGMDACMVTKLPDNDIGKCALRKLAMFGVDTSHITFGGERIGLYYLERGVSQRPSRVIYDRKHSAFSEASVDEFNWDEILNGADWFHFTGITPALSENCAKICEKACITAKQQGVKVSCDLNYRKSLWTPEEAQETMRPLMQYVDILFANEESSEKALGIKMDKSSIVGVKPDTEAYAMLAHNLSGTFGFEKVAIPLREPISASVNNWSGLLYSNGEISIAKKYTIQIVDRIGAGDSFAAGLIYGLLHGMDDHTALEFATAASCLKHSIEFDFNLSTPDEVKAIMTGDASGWVLR